MRLLMRKRWALGLAVVLSASACGGPPNPIEAGVKEFPTDVLLGSTETAAPGAPRGGGTGVELPPILIRPTNRLPERGIEPPTPVEDCPEADPLSAPRQEAFNVATTSPPPPSRYGFRNTGTYSVKGDTTDSGTFRPSNRVVDDVVFTDRSYDFTVADDLGITTRYRVVHTAPTLPSQVPPVEEDDPAGVNRGIYILWIASETPEGVDTFVPTTPIRLASFPLDSREPANATEQTSLGTSASGGTVMSFQWRVGRDVPDPDNPGETKVEVKARVDACGTMLDAYWVELRNGTISGPDKDLEFTALLAVGTQYGGLLLEERWNVTGTAGGAEVTSERRSVINQAPEVPR